MAAGKPVYVHCWGGLGRTGVVVGCWSRRHGEAEPLAKLDQSVTQFSSKSPGMRLNSFSLLVTMIRCLAIAWAAICRS
ncbi:MAG: fused DSP-PTPase phosphatase/NAD kinase-like protein [Candidatus Rifleibacteriota bacterium]